MYVAAICTGQYAVPAKRMKLKPAVEQARFMDAFVNVLFAAPSAKVSTTV
jgi:hypothetical protein